MDAVLELSKEPVTQSQVEGVVLSTFLCGTSGPACASCHPSCKSCAGDVCDPCLTPQGNKIADGAFCQCGTSPNLVDCPVCHASCSTCAVIDDSSQCTGCTITEATLSNTSGGTCSCGDEYVPQIAATSACVPCHPSCLTCTGPTASGCLTCKAAHAVPTNVNGGICNCPDGFVSKQSPITACLPCHGSCRTCITQRVGGCLSCKIPEAILSNIAGGACTCGNGFVPFEGVTSSCVPCAGCSHCCGPRAPQCLPSREIAVFARLADLNYALPLSTAASDALCYRSAIPTSAEDKAAWETILGSLTPDGTGRISVAADNCYRLLEVQWPYLVYWFHMLLPTFTPPLEASEFEVYSIKTVVWLWMLRFGPALLSYDDAWKHLLATLDAPQTKWARYLAWTDGYSKDGKTVRSLPVALNSLSNAEVAVFNLFSTVCSTAGCALKTQCQQVAATSVCATS